CPSTEDGPRMILRIPPGHRMLVVLVQQQPLVAPGLVGAGSHEDEAATQLLAAHVQVQLALLQFASRVTRLVRRPGAGVPDDHVAAAVLAGGDDPLEVEVLQRMVLHVKRRPPYLRIQRRPLRNRPAHQHTVDLQPKVVMQAPGTMPLHDKPSGPVGRGGRLLRGLGGLGRRRWRPRWFRGTREVTLAPVGRQLLLGLLAGRHILLRSAATVVALFPAYPTVLRRTQRTDARQGRGTPPAW